MADANDQARGFPGEIDLLQLEGPSSAADSAIVMRRDELQEVQRARSIERKSGPPSYLYGAMTTAHRSFAVRQADVRDIPHLARHRAAIFRDMGRLAPHLEAAMERATAAYLREVFPRGDYLAWIAEDDGTAPATVGGAAVQLRPILPRPEPNGLDLGPEAIVLNVYVEPQWRRRGIA